MLKLRENTQVYVSIDPIDARKSIDGLSVLVMNVLQKNPQSGHLFLFFNKSRDKVKILWWDKTDLFYITSALKNIVLSCLSFLN